MNLSEPFIRRPVMTTLVMLSILFFGFVSYNSLAVSDLPNVDYPTIQVTIQNPGASPTTMANTVAVPLEQQFMTIDGIETIVSQSLTGTTNMILQFNLDKSIDAASTDVEAAISRAQPNLPPNLPYNPTFQKVNPAQTPIIYLSITCPSMTLYELYDYANTYIGQRLNMVDGVSQIITYGAPYAARIQVDPEKLAAKQIGIDEVVSAVKTGNVLQPLGTLYGPKNEFTIDVDGQLMRADGYNALVVKAQDGSLVRISDLGRALDSTQYDKYKLTYYTKESTKEGVVLAILNQPGANTIQVTNAIDEILPKLQSELPPSLQYDYIFRKSEIINASVADVKLTLIIAFILVVFIIYVSLGKAMNTIIPSLAIPMSILGTFAVMFLLNYSIDTLSLLAITLSIGFLVDDAIVVLENNVRHVQWGETPLEASIKGSREISSTIFSMTLSLSSVFIPMLFLGGVIGRLFREFAVTIFTAVLFSGFISLTLTPLLSSRFIPPYRKDEKKKLVERFADDSNAKMLSVYEKGLHWSMNHRKTILGLGIVSLIFSVFFFMKLPKDFVPNDDEGFIQGFTQARDGISPFLMTKYQDEVATIVRNDPNVDSVISVAAFTGYSTDNQGLFFVRLKPFSERKPMPAVINGLMQKTSDVVGINTYMSPLPLINLQVGYTMKALYQYSLSSLDPKALYTVTPLLMNKLKSSPTFTQVSSDLEISQPQLQIHIDRDRASDLKITAKQVEDFYSFAYSDGKTSTINSPINQYYVIVETLPKFYKDPTVLSSLYIRNGENEIVPMKEIITYKEDVGPLTVNHVNGLTSATISFNLGEGASLGTAIAEINQAAREILPRNVAGVLQGSADIFKKSFANLTFLFLITIFVIYVILGILYESFIHPITVMSALPPATMGGLLTLLIFRQPLSLYSFIGLILLIGIVMKNGIMMVDFANTAITKEKKSPYDAIIEACLIRFRPIMMTTFAALMGAVPIALGIGGSSAQGRIPLGLVIVGGLIFSQALTLFLTPVIYYYFEYLQELAKARWERRYHRQTSNS